MTEPSQYFKGRTVQEQMNEVIGYVDVRAEEVAAAKADDVLQPAEDAKDAAIAAQEAAEDARDTTLAALPQIQQDIADLKAEDVSLDGRLDTVELKVQTAEGNIVTIQGQIVALQTADGQNVKINNINQYAVGLTGNQANIGGIKGFINGISTYFTDWHNTFASEGNLGDIKLFAKLNDRGSGRFLILELMQSSNNAMCYGMLGIHNTTTPTAGANGWITRKGYGGNNPLTMDSILIVSDGTDIYLASRKKTTYGNLAVRVKIANNYAYIDTNPTPQIKWLTSYVNIGDGTGYTLIEVSE